MMAGAAEPLPRKKLILGSLGALALAALIVFGAILPVELDVDPLGLGKLTGIIRLWAPAERKIDPNAGAFKRARDYPNGPRTDVIEIPLNDPRTGFELEYKVHMQKDATLIYEWEAIGATSDRDLYFDFHGHTTPRPGYEMAVSTYKQARGVKQQGSLTAPFDGIQGWFFQATGDKPLLIRLKVTGFYDLIPPGQTGNDKRIIANVPAAQAVAP
jgi:hypothetical protein